MQLQGHRLGAVGEQVQLDAGVLGGGAREHRAHQARLELLEVAHGGQGGAALRVQGLEVRGAAEEALVVGERLLDLAVLRQDGGALRDAEALGGLALGDEEVTHAVLGHDARRFLRQRAAQVIGARRVSLGFHR